MCHESHDSALGAVGRAENTNSFHTLVSYGGNASDNIHVATPVTTSTLSRASKVFSTDDKTGLAPRTTTPRSSVCGLEGLVRDIRVEVRVLFGACREAPYAGRFAFSGCSIGPGGEHLADENRVRAWLADMAELVDAGKLNAKTVNNARTSLRRRPAWRSAAATSRTTRTAGYSPTRWMPSRTCVVCVAASRRAFAASGWSSPSHPQSHHGR
jgi:hypothetical protein